MQRDAPLRVETLDSLIVQSEVPLKDKTIKSYVVNWADNMKLTEEEIKQSFAKFNKREKEDAKVTADIERKIANTIAFYNYVQSLKH